MTKNEIVARWMGWPTHRDKIEMSEGHKTYKELINYPMDYNTIHEAWVKFRDLKFEGVQYFKHSALCFDICVKITHGTITEAFDELVKGIEWQNKINSNG